MLKQKNGHSPVGAGRMTETVVSTTTYNIMREMNFSNHVSPMGGLR